jgi:hypothetical protein
MNLIPEKVGKILEKRETSLYRILKPFALINTKSNQHECKTLCKLNYKTYLKFTFLHCLK